MTLEINDVSLRCMGCSRSNSLDECLKDAWKMCGHCHFAICPVCYGYLDEPKLCLSYTCSPRKKTIDPIPLPVEKIIIYAREQQKQVSEGGLLHKLFYEEGERIHSLPFFVTKEKEEELGDIDDKPTQVQEEIWNNLQVVITKRRGGKFITWEKVY